VRILKHLRDDLVEDGILPAKQVPSFLIECLTGAVENFYFVIDDDDRYNRVHRVLYRMDELLSDPQQIKGMLEINNVKYLFHPSQPWTPADARAFVSAALTRLQS
jgi:hypothetical protein